MGVRLQFSFVGVCALGIFLAGCSDSNSPPPAATTAALPTLAPLPARPGSGTNAASPSPAASPSASASPSQRDEQALAVEAAMKEVDAVYRSPLTLDSCLKDNAGNKACIALASNEPTVRGGVARFTGGFPEGGGFSFVMGRTADSGWHYWFGSQQGMYQLSDLPGELRACGNGNAVTVRASPDSAAASAGTLKDLDTATAQEFRLTKAGSFGTNGARGEGWYRVTGAAAGWVAARESSDAKLGDCALHDAIEGSAPRG